MPGTGGTASGSFLDPVRGFGVTSVSFATETHLSRIANLRAWGVSPEEVSPRLRSGMNAGEAISTLSGKIVITLLPQRTSILSTAST